MGDFEHLHSKNTTTVDMLFLKRYMYITEPYVVEVFIKHNNNKILHNKLFIQQNVQKLFKVTPCDGTLNTTLFIALYAVAVCKVFLKDVLSPNL